jgi:uncharacterized protein (TIGR02996 family)
VREALFAKIRESPDDDGPRLVYADWLMENGDPARGELITIQCKDDPNLSSREDDLLEEHQSRWLAEAGLPPLTKHWFVRGFIETIEIAYEDLLDAAPRLAAHAVLRSVGVTDVRKRSDRWSAIPGLDRVRNLRVFLADDWDDRGTREPLTASDLELMDLSLESIVLDSQDAGDEGLEVLLARTLLRHIAMRRDRVHLARTFPVAPHVERLDVDENRIESFEALSTPNLVELHAARMLAPNLDLPFPKLRVLHMRESNISAPMIRKLDPLALTTLDLSRNPLYTDGIRAITSAPFATQLTKLVLNGAGMESVWDSPNAIGNLASLPAIEHLEFDNNRIEAFGASEIAHSALTKLKTLSLCANRISDVGARAIATAEWPRLESLDLRNNFISARVAAFLRDRFGRIVSV